MPKLKTLTEHLMSWVPLIGETISYLEIRRIEKEDDTIPWRSKLVPLIITSLRAPLIYGFYKGVADEYSSVLIAVGSVTYPISIITSEYFIRNYINRKKSVYNEKI